jgi:hypothetical protein
MSRPPPYKCVKQHTCDTEESVVILCLEDTGYSDSALLSPKETVRAFAVQIIRVGLLVT